MEQVKGLSKSSTLSCWTADCKFLSTVIEVWQALLNCHFQPGPVCPDGCTERARADAGLECWAADQQCPAQLSPVCFSLDVCIHLSQWGASFSQVRKWKIRAGHFAIQRHFPWATPDAPKTDPRACPNSGPAPASAPILPATHVKLLLVFMCCTLARSLCKAVFAAHVTQSESRAACTEHLPQKMIICTSKICPLNLMQIPLQQCHFG